MAAKRDGKRSSPTRGTGPQTVIHGDVHGPVLSGNFNGTVNIGSTGGEESLPFRSRPAREANEQVGANTSGQASVGPSGGPSIVFQKEVAGAVFNFGPQQGVISTGDHSTLTQTTRPPAKGAPLTPATVPPSRTTPAAPSRGESSHE